MSSDESDAISTVAAEFNSPLHRAAMVASTVTAPIENFMSPSLSRLD